MKATPIGLLLGALILAQILSCGGGDDRSAGGPAIGTTTVVNRGNGGEAGSLDPALADDIHAFNILTDLHEGLVTTDAGGRLIPGVSTSWTVSDDGLSYVFSLRENATWSNGDSVTAADFVRAFRRISDPATPSAYGSLLEPIENFPAIKSGDMPVESLGVSDVGRGRLKIQLSRPVSYFLSLLSMPIAFPMHGAAVSPETFADPSRFLGNGPYTLASRQLAGPTRLRRNPFYWEAQSVTIDEVVYHPIVDELTEFNMYRAGELDLTHTIPPGRIDRLRETRPQETRIAPMLALYYIAFDLSEAPFDVPGLRRALSMAVDREQLAGIIGRGELPAYGIVPPDTGGYTGPVYGWAETSRQERIRVARASLADSGYDATRKLTVRYLYDAGGIHEKIALAVGSMWRESLGIEVTFDKREWQYFLETRGRRDEWELMRFSWFGDYNDPLTFLEIFRSDSVQNLPALRSPEYDRLLHLASGSSDSRQRFHLLAEAEEFLLEQYPVIPLYFYVSKHLVSPSVAGFEDNVIDRHPTRFLSLRR